MIFVARTLSAAILFFFLGKANVWLPTAANTALAFGYRFFLLSSPVLVWAGGRGATALSFSIALLGVGCWLNQWYLPGALAVALGLSCGGFLIKSQAAETPTGAATNKIALNVGSLAAGGLLAFPLLQAQTTAYAFTAAVLLLCVMIALISARTTAIPKRGRFFSGGPAATLRWALLGVVIGIKLFGIFSVLPQYLIARTGGLPDWFGLLLSFNSVLIVLFQVPVMKAVRRASRWFILALLGLGLVILGTPRLFFIETVPGALLWVAVLSLIECSASRLDVDASAEHALLPKEAAVGIGAALSVLCTRSFSAEVGAGVLAGFGILLLSFASLLRPKPDR